MSRASKDQLILAIDQGTTNSKPHSSVPMVRWSRAAARRSGSLAASWLGGTGPRTDLVERARGRGRLPRNCTGPGDRRRRANASGNPSLAWQASSGAPLGPVIGWQDRRTANWCNQAIDDQDRQLVHARTGLPVDAMFSAPKMRWLLDNLPKGCWLGTYESEPSTRG